MCSRCRPHFRINAGSWAADHFISTQYGRADILPFYKSVLYAYRPIPRQLLFCAGEMVKNDMLSGSRLEVPALTG